MNVSVYVSECPYHIDKPYSYILPSHFYHTAKIGSRVIVPFGGGNRKKVAVITAFSDEDLAGIPLKPVISLLDPKPVLTKENLALCYFIKDRYFCTFYEAAALLLPPGSTAKFHQRIRMNPYSDQEVLKKYESKPNYEQIIQYVQKSEPVLKEELLKQFENSLGRLNILIKSGVLHEENDLKTQTATKTKKIVKLLSFQDEIIHAASSNQKNREKYQKVVDVLRQNGTLSVQELTYLAGVSLSVVYTMAKKGLVVVLEEPFYHNRFSEITPHIKKDDLSEEQTQVYHGLTYKLNESKPSCTLLKGVTGSGKTHVFLKLIDDVLQKGETALVLFPEISLTTQMIDRFYSCFGNIVGLMHSKMSMRERFDTWQRIKKGEINVVIGTRLAVFAPLSNIGLIVIDEEQESTYKSEMPPKYDARDIAKFRCIQENAMLLLTSATPSVDSISHVKSGKYGFAELKNRYNDALLPKIVICDMRKEVQEGNLSLLSRQLQSLLIENVKNQNQSVLFINRRGYSPYVTCRECGYVAKCQSCSISMNYHRDNERLMCHYCGHSIKKFAVCPECGSSHLSYLGIGTQRVEEEIKFFLPEAKILRMDSDTIMGISNHEELLSQFQKGEFDILLGTQMVTKGLDFENVTLVGVILADLSLNMDDYRAAENTFAILTQVTGRAGRGKKPGVALIQTNDPDNPVIQMAARQDDESFYQEEVNFRKVLDYPPFFDLCQIVVSGQTDSRTRKMAEFLEKQLTDAFVKNQKFITAKMVGMSAAPVRKISNLYRYRILIKCRNDKNYRILISSFLKNFYAQKGNKSFSISVDINPYSML